MDLWVNEMGWGSKVTNKVGEKKLNRKRCTFPSFTIDDGSDAHEKVPSVNLLLLRETLTKLPGNPWLADSPDFFPGETLSAVGLLSAKSAFVEAFFTDALTLFSSRDDFEDSTLFSSLDGNLSLVDFLGTCRMYRNRVEMPELLFKNFKFQLALHNTLQKKKRKK